MTFGAGTKGPKNFAFVVGYSIERWRTVSPVPGKPPGVGEILWGYFEFRDNSGNYLKHALRHPVLVLASGTQTGDRRLPRVRRNAQPWSAKDLKKNKGIVKRTQSQRLLLDPCQRAVLRTLMELLERRLVRCANTPKKLTTKLAQIFVRCRTAMATPLATKL